MHPRINFSVLRAIGSTPRQVASVLAWGASNCLYNRYRSGGILWRYSGSYYRSALVFTGVPTYSADINSGEFYVLQHILTVQVVVPSLLVIVFFVAFVIICVAAIGMMARVASKPWLGQTLRLNAD